MSTCCANSTRLVLHEFSAGSVTRAFGCVRLNRDFGIMGWAGRISMTFLPIAIGQAMKLFPTHAAAYKAFYLIGGSISLAAFLVFALLVHPRDEPLGLSMQCTRGVFHAEYDKLRKDLGADAARAT